MSDELPPPAQPVLAVRIGPGNFLVASGRMKRGELFTVDGSVYELVGEPVSVEALTVLVQVREVDGPDVGREFTARLQGGVRKA